MDALGDRRPDLIYPIRWSYRIVGTSAEILRALVAEIMGPHEHALVPSRASRTGKYVSYHLTLVVRDEAHRLDVYERLRRSETILRVL